MNRTLLTSALAFLLGSVIAFAENEKKTADDGSVIPVRVRKDDIVKTGWNVGILPAFNYNTDLGFMGGVLSQVYNYGDGSDYPNYRHKFTVLASIYSRGAKQLSLDYDSKHLVPGKRVTAHLEYMDNPLCGFYGFNGAVSPYYADFDLRKSADGEDGIAFYADYQKRFVASLDLQGRLADHLTWIGGASYSHQMYSDVSIRPYDGTQTLFHQYVESGLIPEGDTWGHRVGIKAGLVYDTRDFEANPSRGVYMSATLDGGASFSSIKRVSLGVSTDFRHYVPIFPSRLTFVYKLSYSSLVAGSLPFYALPAFGMRGSFGSRITGAGVASASADLRLKAASFKAFKQNIELGLVGFADAGAVVRPYRLAEQSQLGGYTVSKTLDGMVCGPYKSVYDSSMATHEKLHASTGGGFFFSMNHNFITVVEFGKPLDPQDGTLGLYINLGFSF